MDLIKRADAIKALDDGMNKWYSNVTLRASMRDAINSIPSAEKKGEWKVIGYDPLNIEFKCNTCGLKCNLATPYCPECGARMKGSDE